MNKIQWNTVTWYSKALALILFVALPFIGFYYGVQYGKLAAVRPTVQVPPSTIQNDYYNTPAEWQTDANNTKGGFTIAYPIDFAAQDNYSVAPSTDWRVDTADPGDLYFTLTVPAAFEPQTNFVDATFTVGSSANDLAVAHCMDADSSGGQTIATSTAVVNGIVFTIFHSTDVGAGNYYETTSYRTLHAGQCYAVEYTVHSSQIANYPASYDLQPFNEAEVDNMMQAIISTFKFV